MGYLDALPYVPVCDQPPLRPSLVRNAKTGAVRVLSEYGSKALDGGVACLNYPVHSSKIYQCILQAPGNSLSMLRRPYQGGT